MRLYHCLFLFLLVSMPVMAWAEGTPKKIGSFQEWQAYEMRGDACYMMLRPQKMDYKTNEKNLNKHSQNKRNDVYLMITFRPTESMDPVISYRSGYMFKHGSEVFLKTDAKPYALFTEHDQAWARSSTMDAFITNALRKASSVVIQGVSSDGGKSSDRFNLNGAEGAYKAIVKACGIT
jgi:hypothetical protein